MPFDVAPDRPRLPALADITLLADICDDYLGCCFAVARRRFSEGTLPVKAFRLNDRRRGPIYVHNDDLEALIRRRRTRAPAPVHGDTAQV